MPSSKRVFSAICLAAAALFMTAQTAEACNKAICGAVVSKCMLMQSCKCERKGCVCCKDCMHCLADLYSECCSCVDLCQEKNPSETDLGIETNAEKFDKSDSFLFDVLTQEDDALGRWQVRRVEEKWSQTEIDQWELKSGVSISTAVPSLQTIEGDTSGVRTLNCTAAYLPDCMSLGKCLDICRGLGSSGYRFFPDGCCECFGSTCKDNGVDKSQCLKCPNGEDDEADFEDEELYIHRDVEDGNGGEDRDEDKDAVKSASHPEMQNDISSG